MIKAGEEMELINIIHFMIERYYDNEASIEDYYQLCDYAKGIINKYGSEIFYKACIDFLSDPNITETDTVRFTNTFFALGMQDTAFLNPYTLIALIYIKANIPQISEETENLCWSLSVALVKSSNLYHGYVTDYEPLNDENVLAEINRLRVT